MAASSPPDAPARPDADALEPQSEPHSRSIERDVAALTEVLLAVAGGRFDARAPRTNRGDAMDVLAFLVNSTVEEVASLVGELRAERDELRRTQAQLVHAAKLLALGELAGGVAHELNQPLTVMRTLVELAQMSGEPPTDEDLEQMRAAVERMARIVDNVRTFGRRSPMSIVASQADAPVIAALDLMTEQLRTAGIAVAFSAEPRLPRVMADVHRLQQVVVNLVANARDALIARPEPERPLKIAIAIWAEAELVGYSVEDSGPGIASEHVPHVFDPFFTTKPVGKGTGLGLSVSYGIVRDHGGDIRCEPARLGGARFVFRIPVAELRDQEPEAGAFDPEEPPER